MISGKSNRAPVRFALESTFAMINALARFISSVYVHSLTVIVPRWDASWSITVIISVLAYMALVSKLRFRRAANLQSKYNLTTRSSFRTMSTDIAQLILKDLTELEFPKIFGFSIVFALFKGGNVLSLSVAGIQYCNSF